MIIHCENVTAQYPLTNWQKLCSLKNKLPNRTIQPDNRYPLFDFSCTFHPGLTILLGPNSAGKSTLLRLLLGDIVPVCGTIRFNQQSLTPKKRRPLISYLPQTFALYQKLTAYEMLEYIALLKGIANSEARAASIKKALAETNLTSYPRQKIKTYSQGMKQRLGIAQTLLTPTPILLLDEPTAGLDPEERKLFLLLLRKLAQQRLIIFAASNLADITYADRAVILQQGHCRFAGSPTDLAEAAKVEAVSVAADSLTNHLQQGYQSVLNRRNQS